MILAGPRQGGKVGRPAPHPSALDRPRNALTANSLGFLEVPSTTWPAAVCE